jgi:hypothetical protein
MRVDTIAIMAAMQHRLTPCVSRTSATVAIIQKESWHRVWVMLLQLWRSCRRGLTVRWEVSSEAMWGRLCMRIRGLDNTTPARWHFSLSPPLQFGSEIFALNWSKLWCLSSGAYLSRREGGTGVCECVCVKKSRIFRNTFKILMSENLEPVHSSTGRITKK